MFMYFRNTRNIMFIGIYPAPIDPLRYGRDALFSGSDADSGPYSVLSHIGSHFLDQNSIACLFHADGVCELISRKARSTGTQIGVVDHLVGLPLTGLLGVEVQLWPGVAHCPEAKVPMYIQPVRT